MMLAHGDVALNFWFTVLLVVFGIPFLFLLIYRKKSYGLPVAFAAVCVGLCILLLYLIFAPQ